jgi:hypothetical protein
LSLCAYLTCLLINSRKGTFLATLTYYHS